MSCFHLQSSITWYFAVTGSFLSVVLMHFSLFALHSRTVLSRNSKDRCWLEDLKLTSHQSDSSPALKMKPLIGFLKVFMLQMQCVSDLQSADFKNIFGLMLPSADCYILPLSLLIELPSFLSFFAPAAPSGRWGGPPERGQGHFTRGYHLSNEERQGKSTPIWDINAT